ncbi:MAG: glutaredoxin family protein [Desulfovibrio sp.]|uniref:glutaredoxin family protein n=1 Tax=Desulfovibrio sp. 7SRBS1 TaxID=3378064 RepID=UPI003B40AA0F
MSIKFFGLSTCIHCKKARQLLEECNADFDCTYVDQLTGEERQNCIEELKRHNPGLSFPTIVFENDEVVVGFDEQKIRNALDK